MNVGYEQIAIRLPFGMRDQLKAVAKSANRSVNAQVITIFEGVLGAAAGGSFGDQAPAAGNNAATLAGGASNQTDLGKDHQND